jgi:prophage antirepressor-like protein
MTDVTTFAFTRSAEDVVNVRTTLIDGEPWFVGADVLRTLFGRTDGYGHIYRRLAADEVTKVNRKHFEGRAGKALTLISESGLYKLILRSDKREAVANADGRICPSGAR